MNMMEIIRSRKSVRTFDGNALKQEDADGIIKFAEKLENPYDIPIFWKILDGKKYDLSSSVIAGTDCFIAGKLPRVPYAVSSMRLLRQ